MTRTEFGEFLTALLGVIRRRGHDAALLEISESGDEAALPMPDGSWDTIRREHLDPVDGTSVELAEAVYGAYLEDKCS